MSEAILEEQIAAATAYENLFVPALFQEWVPRVADAAGIGPNQRVLDVACGTGVLAREAAIRVGEGGFVAGVDPNPGMLAVAARLAPDIEWRAGTAEALPYPDRSFDAVVSQFGLMFFRDWVAALREMLRVLTPGGRLAAAVWDSLEHNPAYAAEAALVERLAGPQAADALSAPFVLGDREALAALLMRAGAGEIQVSAQRGLGRFPSLQAMVEADLRGWLPVMGVILPEDLIQRILAEAEQALSAFVTPSGSVEFDSPALIVTGVKT